MEIVTSRHNPAVQLARSLAQKKHRGESGLFFAEGPQQLERAKAKGWVPQLLFATAPVEPWGDARRILINENLMSAITGRDNPPSVLGVFAQAWSEMPLGPQGVWLMLDRLRDPGNLGTIIRTADAVAASGIILSGEGCDPWSPDCVRAAAGSIFAVPLVRLEGAAENFVRQWPGEAVAAQMDAVEDYRRSYRLPSLLVVGGESKGLAPALAEACHAQVRIPMPGGIESLNAAIATALLLYEIRRSAL